MRNTLLKLALTCTALWFVFHNIAWEELRAAIHNQQPIYLWATLCAVLLQNICGGLRWHHIRRGFSNDGQDNLTRTTLIYYASNFFNIGMPSTFGGDVARIWLVKKSGITMKEALYGVIIDRMLSLLGLLLLVATNLPILFLYLGYNHHIGMALAAACWIATFAGYGVMFLLLPKLKAWLRFPWAQDVLDALTQIASKHRALLCSLAWSIAAHITYSIIAYALARSLGIDISLTTCIVLLPLVLFVATMPISLGGWGVREMGMVHILALAHVGSAPALLLSLQLGLVGTLSGLLGGAIYLALRK